MAFWQAGGIFHGGTPFPQFNLTHLQQVGFSFLLTGDSKQAKRGPA